MEFTYTCQNNNCSYPGTSRFTMSIDEQAVMDDRNMATVFCPFCKKQMHLTIIGGPGKSQGSTASDRMH